MRHRFGTTLFFVFLFAAGSFGPAAAKYYKYRDANGVLHFVDDCAEITDQVVPEMETIAEPYDHLSEAERKERIRQHEKRIESIRKESKKQLRRLKRAQERDALMEQEKKALEKKNREKTTPIEFIRNSIFVQATAISNGRSYPLRLVLDTGASVTVIYGPAAKRLGLNTTKAGKATLAGGEKTRVKKARLQTLSVGPKKVAKMDVMVFGYSKETPDYDGLLGMDFLRHFPHVVDTQGKMIVWAE